MRSPVLCLKHPQPPFLPPCENWERLIESSNVKKSTNREKKKTEKKEAYKQNPTYILSNSKIYDTQYLL